MRGFNRLAVVAAGAVLVLGAAHGIGEALGAVPGAARFSIAWDVVLDLGRGSAPALALVVHACLVAAT